VTKVALPSSRGQKAYGVAEVDNRCAEERLGTRALLNYENSFYHILSSICFYEKAGFHPKESSFYRTMSSIRLRSRREPPEALVL
jgi:hypothetical protein